MRLSGRRLIGLCVLLGTLAVLAIAPSSAMAADGTIRGRVIDEAYHNGLPDISVMAYAYDAATPWDMYWVGDTMTDADGNYQLTLPPGQIVLEFADYSYNRRYIAEFYNNTRLWESATKISLGSGATVSNINAILSEGAHIKGMVTDETNGQPLVGIRVAANFDEDNSVEAFTRVDGSFDITGLDSGTYTVSFWDIGWTDPVGAVYVPEFYNGVASQASATDVSVIAPGAATGINASMKRGGSIAGSVLNQATSLPIVQPSGEWANTPWVFVWTATGEEAGWTQVDEDGDYRIGGLPAGTYKVQFTDWMSDWSTTYGGTVFTSEWYNEKASQATANGVSISGSQAYTTVNGTLSSKNAWGSITGVVTDATTARPLVGVPVTLYERWVDGTDVWWNQMEAGYVTTDADGRYTFPYVPPGTYHALIGGSEDWDLGGFYSTVMGYDYRFYSGGLTQETATNIVVTAGSQLTRNQALPRSSGVLSMQGTVYDDTNGGAVPAGVPVYINLVDPDWGPTFWGEAVTDALGFWSYPIIPGRTYQVGYNTNYGIVPPDQGYVTGWYQAEAQEASATPIVSALGGPTVVNDALPAAGSIEGRITAGATGIEGAFATAFQFDGAFWNPVGEARADANGDYSIGGLRSGDYRVGFSAPYPNPTRLAGEYYPDKINIDSATTVTVTEGLQSSPYNAQLDPGVEFRAVTYFDDSDANVGQNVKVHALYNDPTDGWIEVASGYAYSGHGGETWFAPMRAGQYKFLFDDLETVAGYDPMWYLNKISQATATVVNEVGGTLKVLLQSMDATPPDTTTDALGGYRGSATIHISATDAVSGVQTTYYSLDGGADTPGSSVTVSAPGWHELEYYSVDKLNNVELKRSVSFEILPLEAAEPVAIAGETRIDTAIMASQEAFGDGTVETVVIATGYNWPDALGGAALAGAYDGPILLTKQGDLPATVAAEIDRLGATEAVILGGTAAVNTDVEQELWALLGSTHVTRLAGLDRYDTARRIAAKTIQVLGGDYDGTAFVATGGKFPDALGASPLSAASSWPIYLAHPVDGLTAATKTAMQTGGVTDVLVLGGTTVVSSAIETDLKTLFGSARVTRLAGVDRYATSCIVAQYGIDNAGLYWNRLAIATGANFPDALAGGVLQGREGSVMLLTPSATLDGSVLAKLTANKGQINEVRFLGGLNAVTAGVRSAVEAAIQ